jgi:hypothetical protein
MPNFIKNFIRDFLDVYIDENQIREAYGNEYADRFAAVDPVTGKRKISVAKILKRVVGVFIFAIFLFFIIRVSIRVGW